MNVFGIGVDVVEVERIESAISTYGERFLDRTFTEGERRYCEAQSVPGPHYAVRFAAKESVSKAFGTGIGKDVGLKEVEVFRSSTGVPEIVLHGNAARFAEEQGISRVMVSLSHTRHSAVAQAMAIVDSP